MLISKRSGNSIFKRYSDEIGLDACRFSFNRSPESQMDIDLDIF